MKKFFKVVTVILLAINSWAQAPQSFSYQAVMRGLNNELVVNKPVGMKISLLQGSEIGNPIYVETHNSMANANGLVSIAIGAGTKVSGDFETIDWSKGLYFVRTETDVSGGTSYSLTSVSQLLSVPYAIHAKTAESIVGSNLGNNSGAFAHYIGEEFGGGVIFHLWKDKLGVEHGLVASISDQSISQVWSNISDIEMGEIANSSWNGLGNSIATINQNNQINSAAKLCLDLVEGGFDDWYLPSIDELSLLWHCRFNVNKTLYTIVHSKQLSSLEGYWSSSENGTTNAWFFAFNTGRPSNGTKTDKFFVRAVRTF
jgi:hypothetical protein